MLEAELPTVAALGCDGCDAAQSYVEARHLPDAAPHDLLLELDVIRADVGQGSGEPALGHVLVDEGVEVRGFAGQVSGSVHLG